MMAMSISREIVRDRVGDKLEIVFNSNRFYKRLKKGRASEKQWERDKDRQI